ncbi:unnamed protein product [Adineta ricciae]|uniref:THAP9-like helix-turn-helix domain-containing protein n=2 Tax=Adineta ricciae TaxID=249248 RepID=A0A815V167_ADIRI|nr:unnamed protein product [Adineta ricciae]
MTDINDLSPFVDIISSLSGDAFYDFVKQFVGADEAEILKIQQIKNTRILLRVPDVFSFFAIKNSAINDLKERACFVNEDMQYVVKAGIQSNIDLFIDFLKKHQELKSSVQDKDDGKLDSANAVTQNVMPNESKSFAQIFIQNLLKNMKKSSNNYKFDDTINKFASALHLLAGHHAYEFIRINLSGALPSATTINKHNEYIDLRLRECEFRFDSLKNYLDSIDSNFVFSSEDSTGAIKSISYDSTDDCFIGFCSPLINGLPSMSKFKTENYYELEQWSKHVNRSSLVNAHLIEPIQTKASSQVHSRPYVLSAYGTDDKVTASDILRRWLHIYNQCKERDIHVVGFSSDCAPKYLKAMRLALRFFTRAPNIDLITGNEMHLNIDIPPTWSFFFMNNIQPFLCMQDGIHLITKIRNRLLSSTAKLCMNGHDIGVNYLLHILENYSKIEHNLVKTDVIPHDRQNYSSCVKITSDDVLNLLNQIDAKATYAYLYVLKLLILTYVKSNTSIKDRLLFGWTAVFFYRMWWSSLRVNQGLSSQDKDKAFITKSAFYSAEINIHCLTSIIILVSTGRLPPYSLNTYLFSSQACEATFRTARSLTGVFSSITNFSVHEFMNKIEKISILNHIKSSEESNDTTYSLKFPAHHKHRRNEATRSMNSQDALPLTLDDIENIVVTAYHDAELIMKDLKLTETMKKHKLNDLNTLNSFVFTQLTKCSTIDYSAVSSIDDEDEDSDDDDSNNNDILTDYSENERESDEDSSVNDNQGLYHLIVSKQTFHGMKIYDVINPAKANHYFKIFSKDKPKYTPSGNYPE